MNLRKIFDSMQSSSLPSPKNDIEGYNSAIRKLLPKVKKICKRYSTNVEFPASPRLDKNYYMPDDIRCYVIALDSMNFGEATLDSGYRAELEGLGLSLCDVVNDADSEIEFWGHEDAAV